MLYFETFEPRRLCAATVSVRGGALSSQPVPKFDHVVVVIEENKPYSIRFSAATRPRRTSNRWRCSGCTFTASFGIDASERAELSGAVRRLDVRRERRRQSRLQREQPRRTTETRERV
jgi:hypothetical protein